MESNKYIRVFSGEFSVTRVQLHNYAFLPVSVHAFVSLEKRSQIFGSEEPNLIARRTKSYCHKNQILRAEDMAAFLPTSNSYDYQQYTRTHFYHSVCPFTVKNAYA